MKQKHSVGLAKKYFLVKLWHKLYDEFIKRFGFPDIYLDIIRKEKEIALYRIDKLLSGDETIQVFIDICTVELENLKKANKGGSFWELKASMERVMGFRIDPMQMSVGEFYTHLKTLEKESKKVNTKLLQ